MLHAPQTGLLITGLLSASLSTMITTRQINPPIVFFFLISAFLFCPLQAQQVASTEYAETIEVARGLLDSLHRHGKVPGLDVAVSVNGEVVWSEGFGWADVEQKAPVVPGVTRFRIGSVSKPLAAVGLGLLIDQGKMDVNKEVQTYVPAFPQKKYPLTVKQIGGHIGGIRHYRGDEFLSSKKFGSVEESLTIFEEDTLLFVPGTDFSYSSYGFNLLSAVIEGAADQEFLAYMRENVFGPLQMNSTVEDKNDSIINGRTSFYALDREGTIINAPYVDNSYKWAGGGYLSTTMDLLKFGQAMMTPGLLTENTWNELTTSQKLENGKETGYGIGWSAHPDRSTGAFGHSGGSVGGITQFRIYPKQKLVIVMLSNSSDTRYGNLTDRLVALFSR